MPIQIFGLVGWEVLLHHRWRQVVVLEEDLGGEFWEMRDGLMAYIALLERLLLVLDDGLQECQLAALECREIIVH